MVEEYDSNFDDGWNDPCDSDKFSENMLALEPYSHIPLYGSDEEQSDNEVPLEILACNTPPHLSDDRAETTFWCRCFLCGIMPTARESICCFEIAAVNAKRDDTGERLECISQHPDLKHLFHQTVLESTHWLMSNIRSDKLDLDNKGSLRYAAYRLFTGWVYGRLGVGCRKVIPSCVISKIRQLYPNPLGNYTGFHDATHY